MRTCLKEQQGQIKVKMDGKKLVNLNKIIQLEKSIEAVANSGEILQTINLCDKLKETAKENVKIAHSLRNNEYSAVSQRLKILQEQSQYLSQEDKYRMGHEVELLSQAADIAFHNHLKYLQEDLPMFTRGMAERARLKYHFRKKNSE